MACARRGAGGPGRRATGGVCVCWGRGMGRGAEIWDFWILGLEPKHMVAVGGVGNVGSVWGGTVSAWLDCFVDGLGGRECWMRYCELLMVFLAGLRWGVGGWCTYGAGRGAEWDCGHCGHCRFDGAWVRGGVLCEGCGFLCGLGGWGCGWFFHGRREEGGGEGKGEIVDCCHCVIVDSRFVDSGFVLWGWRARDACSFFRECLRHRFLSIVYCLLSMLRSSFVNFPVNSSPPSIPFPAYILVSGRTMVCGS